MKTKSREKRRKKKRKDKIKTGLVPKRLRLKCKACSLIPRQAWHAADGNLWKESVRNTRTIPKMGLKEDRVMQDLLKLRAIT